MANILVIEDDKIQRDNLVKMLGEIEGRHNIYEAGSGEDALRLAEAYKIDLFFIDVNLPDITGIEFAAKIREVEIYRLTWMIFITTSIEYMLHAFKGVHCYDYILKPYDKEAVKKTAIELLKDYDRSKGAKLERKSISLDIKGILVKVYVDEIIFIEVFVRTCAVHTIRGIYKVTNLTLKRIMEMLDHTKLIQSHKSYLVNPDYIRRVDKSGSSWVIHFDGSDGLAYIGDKYRKQIMNNIEQSKIYESEELNI